jgi:transposase
MRIRQPQSLILVLRFQPLKVVLEPRTTVIKPRVVLKSMLWVHTMGHLLSLVVSAGNVDDRVPVYDLCEQVQELTGDTVLTMFTDKGYSGEAVQDDADGNIIRLVVMKKPEAVKGFVLLPMRWVVERLVG